MRAGQGGDPRERRHELVSPVVGDDVEMNPSTDAEMRDGNNHEFEEDRVWSNALMPFDPDDGEGGVAISGEAGMRDLDPETEANELETREQEASEQDTREAEANEQEELERPNGLSQSMAPGGGRGGDDEKDEGHGQDEGIADGRGISAEEQEEEGAQPRELPAPARVTADERERHELTHTPFRSWCRACVKGRGVKNAHRTRGEEEKREDHAARGVPKIAMDYMYLNDQLDDVAQSPILVMVDESTGEKYARVVSHKGLGPAGEADWAVQDASEELRAWGHQGGAGHRLILKSDGEPAIVAFRNALGRYHGGIVIPEAAATHESQSNGAAEQAVRIVREYTRVFKEQIQEHTGLRLKGSETIVTWMVRWAAMCVSRYMLGKDGRSAYERRTGRPCRIPVCKFGEHIWYKEARDQKERRDKWNTEEREGVWLGHTRSSNEHLIGTPGGVVKAYSIRRKIDEERWSKQAVEGMKGTPDQMKPGPGAVGGGGPPVDFGGGAMDDLEPDHVEKPPVLETRRFRITPTMLEEHGYTDGCDGCQRKRAGLRGHAAHSEVCRQRVAEALKQTAAGRAVRRREQERMHRRAGDAIPADAGDVLVAAMLDGPGAQEEAMERGHGDALEREADLKELTSFAARTAMESCSAHVEEEEKRDARARREMCMLDEKFQPTAYDDVSGAWLDPAAVRQARKQELEYIEKMKVWKIIDRAEATRLGISVIGTRWIDINKGDVEQPIHRSRLVAQEYNVSKEEGLFASTPPLEALKALVSDAATTNDGGTWDQKVVMVVDVSRAFFEAPVQRRVCAELPPELRSTDKDEVALLVKSLYGTRDAAANFQKEVRKFMVSCGFRVGRYSASTFFHRARNLKVVVHGDDFITVGRREAAAWFRERLAGRFEIKTKVIGDGVDDVAEARVLNRVLRRTAQGWELEADQRHAELVVKALDLMEAKTVSTPGEEPKPWQEVDDAIELGPRQATEYRGLAARINYLALDRADLQFATKQACQGMAKPTTGDWRALKRIARYIAGKPRLVIKYIAQEDPQFVDVYSDSDWAGDRRTGRSTSGGALRIGAHLIKTWSSTQRNITLSSGEAELIAAVKAASEGLGVVNMLSEWGQECRVRVWVDSSAAIGVVHRRGSGKMRHVRLGHLWIQQKVEEKELDVRKVAGASNPADLLTKILNGRRIDEIMYQLGCEFRSGRAQAAPNLQ